MGPSCSRVVVESMPVQRWRAGAGSEGLRVCRAPRRPHARCRSEHARCAGRQYADRQPIGLESVIREVPASVVRDFYRRWYRRATLFALVTASGMPSLPSAAGQAKMWTPTDAMPCLVITLLLTLRCGCKRWPSPVCEQRAAVHCRPGNMAVNPNPTLCRPENMAVVAVGNFPDTGNIIAALERHFGVPGSRAAGAPPHAPIPRCAAIPAARRLLACSGGQVAAQSRLDLSVAGCLCLSGRSAVLRVRSLQQIQLLA
jgi:hypothetical protein